MNIVIDIGNTQSKVGVFSTHETANPMEIFTGTLDETLRTAIQSIGDLSKSRAILSSVSNLEKLDKCTTILNDSGVPYTFVLTHRLPVPIENSYKTPETLGMDRLAAVIGGKKLFPEQDILVIDAGTCITFDYLEGKTYRGGAISPGLKIKLKALHNFTANLPLVELEPTSPMVGIDTQSSIMSGVLNGTIAEINQTISEYKGISDNLAVILCGGDAVRLKSRLQNVDSVEQDLVLKGLNEILNYNVQNGQ